MEYYEGYAAGYQDATDVAVSWSRHAYARVWIDHEGTIHWQTNHANEKQIHRLLRGVDLIEDSLVKSLEEDDDDD